jgi:hypothetical protein
MPYINGKRYFEHRVTATYYVLSDKARFSEDPALNEAMARAEIKHIDPSRIHIYSLNPKLCGEDR